MYQEEYDKTMTAKKPGCVCRSCGLELGLNLCGKIKGYLHSVQVLRRNRQIIRKASEIN